MVFVGFRFLLESRIVVQRPTHPIYKYPRTGRVCGLVDPTVLWFINQGRGSAPTSPPVGAGLCMATRVALRHVDPPQGLPDNPLWHGDLAARSDTETPLTPQQVDHSGGPRTARKEPRSERKARKGFRDTGETCGPANPSRGLSRLSRSRITSHPGNL